MARELRLHRLRQGLVSLAVAGVSTAAIAGCGTASSSSAPSGLDPAAAAPASSAAFAEFTVRPQGGARSDALATLHTLLGSRTNADVQKLVGRLVDHDGVSYDADLEPWLGQRVGLAVTRIPAAGASAQPVVAIIAPTNNPSAARSFITRQLRQKDNAGFRGTVVGHYAIVAGASAYPAVLAALEGPSLATSAAYRAASAKLAADSVLTGWVDVRQLGPLLATAAAKDSAHLGSTVSQQLLAGELSQEKATGHVAFSLTSTARSIDLREVSLGAPAAETNADAGADVSRLPAGSWLAVSGGQGFASGAFRAGASRALDLGLGVSVGSAHSGQLLTTPAAVPRTASAVSSQLRSLNAALTGALGPFSLAIAGSSPFDIGVGLTMQPPSAAAGQRLVVSLHDLLARDQPLVRAGGTTSFSVPSPLGRSVDVVDTGRRFSVVYGSSLAAFLTPATHLSSNPAYAAARSELPADDSVPVFLNFAPIATLASLADASPSAAKTQRVLGRLSYVIAGTHDGVSDIVVGIR